MEISDSAWKYAVRFHGHACPGLAMGAAMALGAVRALGLSEGFLLSADFSGEHNFSSDEELVCIAETDACSVDAMQALLGCTLGKGNLLLKMRGKNAFSFHHRPSRRSVRLIWTAPERQLDRSERIDWFLSGDSALYTVQEIPYLPPEEALISKSVPCSVCGEMVFEPLIRMRGGKAFCLDCFPDPSRLL